MRTYVTRKKGDLKGKNDIQGNQLTNFGLIELILALIVGKLPLFFVKCDSLQL